MNNQYEGNIFYRTHDITTKQPNELGLYDMNENVWEFCSDWYDNYSRDEPTEPYNGTKLVIHSGSWNVENKFCTPLIPSWMSTNQI